MSIMSYEALKQAVEKAGGQAALARAVGISQPSVWHWLHRSRRIPAEFVVAVEAATGIDRRTLRPDLYPPARRRSTAGRKEAA